MAGRGLPPERVQVVLGYLAAGLNPMRAARAAGVSKSFAYRLDHKVSGVSRLAVKRQAAARRAAARAARPGRGLPPERVRALVDLLAAGLSPNQAGPAAGVPESFAYVLHHKMGGVYRPPGVTYSTRYLDREERYELARLREDGLPMRQIAAPHTAMPAWPAISRLAAAQPGGTREVKGGTENYGRTSRVRAPRPPTAPRGRRRGRRAAPGSTGSGSSARLGRQGMPSMSA